MRTEKTRTWFPMPSVQGRQGIIFFNPLSDELAFEDNGERLVELPADEENLIRTKFADALEAIRRDHGLQTS